MVLEDVERIEVISGPGGTMWGANAVNGVINIITKSAEQTQGLYASGAAGTYLRKQGTIRYGGTLGSDISYRVYAQHSDRDHTFLPDGTEVADKWNLTQSGFRMDYKPSEESKLMFQGNFYGGREHTLPKATTLDGQNILGSWTRTFSKSQLEVQAYFDRTWRRMPTIGFELKTYDLDIQHRFPLGKRQSILMGAGYYIKVCLSAFLS
jgi:iron complex outermembrane receptor protein